MRHLSPLDRWLSAADAGLRTVCAPPSGCTASPADEGDPPAAHGTCLLPEERALSGALMRVNHVGEVCAQALYTAQALAARWPGRENEALAQQLEAAGREETDHLAWTQERLKELGSRPSLLNPLWYSGAFGLGLVAGAMGKGVSLGFVVETERQVEAHLAEHLASLPEGDDRSRAILAVMKDDEARHADDALAAGARLLPPPIPAVMAAMSKAMKTVAYRL